MFDVGALLEDAETKNAALERVEELEENISHVTTSQKGKNCLCFNWVQIIMNISHCCNKWKDLEDRNELPLGVECYQKSFWVLSKKAGVFLQTKWTVLPCLSSPARILLSPDFLATLVIGAGELDDWHYLERSTIQVCECGLRWKNTLFWICHRLSDVSTQARGQQDLVASWCRSSHSCLMVTQVLSNFI